MYEKLRLRSPKIVWDEIERLVADYGVDYVWDVADNFLSDKNWFQEFYRESRHRTKKPFLKIQTRVDELADERIVEMLRDLNVVQLFIGFESDDDRRLMEARKGTTSSINKKAVRNSAKYNIGIRGYFVLGLPGETSKSLAKTVKLAEEILEAGDENSIVVPFFAPVPGSPSYKFFIKKTGKKYAGQDVIDWKEAIHDWVKYFSVAQYKTIKKAQQYLESRNRDLPI